MKYGICNFRRLEKVEPIEFKRITILVGRNSSGKSSYLRSLLLLKQSITTKTNDFEPYFFQALFKMLFL